MYTPDKAGVYYAQRAAYYWYNLIVILEGNAPFLYAAVVYDRALGRIVKDYPLGDITAWYEKAPEP